MLSKKTNWEKPKREQKGIMGITKDKLFGAIAELIDSLLEYGCEHDSLVHALTYYGFTKEQLKEWYGIGE